MSTIPSATSAESAINCNKGRTPVYVNIYDMVCKLVLFVYFLKYFI